MKVDCSREYFHTRSVVLIYDSVRTVQGQLAIKALRLTDQFCDAHRSKRISAEGYVEVQVYVHA